MQFSGIYAITDDNLLTPERLLAATEAALAAGISLLQFRSKSGSPAEKQALAAALQNLCSKYDVPLIINDDVDLCLAVAAAGVHLGRSDTALPAARAKLGTDKIIGVTCHSSLQEALIAEQSGADYVAFGRFYPSQTKPNAPPAQLALLTAARQQLSVPIVAIGGINAENGAAVRRAGADMLAVVHAIFGSRDVTASTSQLVQLFETQTDSTAENH